MLELNLDYPKTLNALDSTIQIVNFYFDRPGPAGHRPVSNELFKHGKKTGKNLPVCRVSFQSFKDCSFERNHSFFFFFFLRFQ